MEIVNILNCEAGPVSCTCCVYSVSRCVNRICEKLGIKIKKKGNWRIGEYLYMIASEWENDDDDDDGK